MMYVDDTRWANIKQAEMDRKNKSMQPVDNKNERNLNDTGAMRIR
jgi:hypothetical protein